MRYKKIMLDEYADESGRIPRSAIQAGWWKPSEAFFNDADDLVWSWAERKRLNPGPEKLKRIVQDFIAITDPNLTSEEVRHRILQFARRWGVLCICRHNLPAAHLSSDAFLNCQMCGTPNIATCYPHRLDDSHCWESIESWLRFSRVIRTMFHIGAVLKNKPTAKRKELPEETWQVLTDWRAEVMFGTRDDNIGRGEFVIFVDDWSEIAGLRKSWRWSTSPSLVLAAPFLTGGVFAPVLLHAALMIFGESGLALCSKCGEPFFIRRGQSLVPGGRNRYCEGCSGEAYKRARAKYQRKRRRGAVTPTKPRLTTQQKQRILRLCNQYRRRKQKGLEVEKGFYKRVAKQFNTSESTIYKIQQGRIQVEGDRYGESKKRRRGRN